MEIWSEFVWKVCEYVEEKVVNSMQQIQNCNKVKRSMLFEKDSLERQNKGVS